MTHPVAGPEDALLGRTPGHRRSRRRAVAVAAAGCLTGLLAACGTTPGPNPAGPAGTPVAAPLAQAPEPAVSPPAQANLPGTVTDLDGAPEGVVVTDNGTVAVNVRDPDGLVVVPVTSAGAPAQRRFVALGGAARHLTLGGPNGPALVAEENTDQFVQVALPGGQTVSSVRVGRQPHEAFHVAGPTDWVADEFGNTYHIVVGGRVTRVVPAPLQPGGGTASEDGMHVVGVGVRGRRITEYSAGGDTIGSANCGAGPTHVTTGDDGLFWVNDTNGDAVLGFTLTPHGPRQVSTIPTGAGSKPYGLAYDSRRHTLWTTLTGRNQVLGLTLRNTTIVHRDLKATVRQPNTVAVYPATGAIVVTGSTPHGHLQFLPADNN